MRSARRARATREATRAAIDALTSIKHRLTAQGEVYWAGQAEIQRRSASAWLALAEGRKDEALAEMRDAAALEDGTEKSAVTPGPLAPARELVGEMLLQMNRPAEALEEFEATLKKEPNRFRALVGAATGGVAHRATVRRPARTPRRWWRSARAGTRPGGRSLRRRAGRRRDHSRASLRTAQRSFADERDGSRGFLPPWSGSTSSATSA